MQQPGGPILAGRARRIRPQSHPRLSHQRAPSPTTVNTAVAVVVGAHPQEHPAGQRDVDPAAALHAHAVGGIVARAGRSEQVVAEHLKGPQVVRHTEPGTGERARVRPRHVADEADTA